MSAKLSQRQRVIGALAPQDVSTAKTSAYASIVGARQIMAAVASAALIASRKVTVQFMQAVDASGTGAKPFGAPVDKVAATAGPVSFVADAYTERLDEGFSFVAVQLVSDNGSAVSASAVLMSGGNRYNP